MLRPHALALLLVVVLLAAAPARAGDRAPLPRIAFNDNTALAGTLENGVLRLELEVRVADWHPLGPEKAGVPIVAFGERGSEPSIPGPLVRVAAGTLIHATVTNTLDSALVVHGLSVRRVDRMDSLLVPPRSTREVTFVADVEGTYYYWGTTTGRAVNAREFEDSQLSGALIVDPAAPAAVPVDRVFVFGSYFDGRNADGERDDNREFLTINGRPWPLTERLEYALGDSIRWRFINPTVKVHPMHLHGFYYRVDARGDMERDTIFWPAERRMAVTERMDPGTTMTMVWSPDRPGGWLFHCHLNFHVVANPRLGAEAEDEEAYVRRVLMSDEQHDAQHHVEQSMGGLMMATRVRAPDGWRQNEPARRKLRLFVQSDSAASADQRRFAFVLQEGTSEPAPDSIRSPGSLLLLQRGEPTSIQIINRTLEATQIHWHGLELDSYFDGVVGIGGHVGMPTPAIMPGDSFEVRLTPPRTGTFMYHTHMSDIRQQGLGLYGTLLVLEDRSAWDPSRDLAYLAGGGGFTPVKLFTPTEDPATLQAGSTYRLRMMNVTLTGPGLQYRLTLNGAPIQWLPVAKDGHDLPREQRRREPSHRTVTIGETLDVEVVPPIAGEMWMELRTANGRLVGMHLLQVAGRTPPER
jgi:FtsP/CotA-like multicopper oxidase with cupredoxin domain